ncbi:MAG: matrixin family metalloprotease [Acidobacteriia bacterium]|nr:matrixin family metalloprotease [Terriglobia bacterium]
MLVRRPARHFLVQFASYPGPDLRNQLAQRHIQVLAYVPDDSLMVSGLPPLNLAGLGVSWSGPLDAADKISPALAALPAGAYVVVFHPDVDMAAARTLAVEQGFEILENPNLLPGQLLVTGSSGRLDGLAARDEVAYILPALVDLLTGERVMSCAGPIAEAGPMAEYVAVGRGWAKDTGGGVALQYFFDSTPGNLDANLARGEVERAFREWARYANISFTSADQAAAARSIDILFASGAHGDPYPFDGPGGVLAHTFYPAPPNTEPIAGDMHLDASEDWHAGTSIDLFTVALHEAGHALGLGHSDNPGAVMYPYYRLATGLTNDDIAGIRALYGANGETQPPPGTPVQPPSPPPPNPPAPSPPGPPSPPANPPPPTPPNPPPTPPTGGTDTTPPFLQVVSPGSTIVSTSSAAIAISGSASDNVGVTAVKWSTSTGSSGDAAGTATWSASVPLLVGTNVVTVRAFDATGNSAWRAITVVRR